MLVWTLLLFVLLGIVLWWAFTRHAVSGKVESTGPTLGGWTMHPNTCAASSIGAIRSFTLTDSHRPLLMLHITTQDTEAPQVRTVSTADGQPYAVEYDRCGVNQIHTSVPPGANALEGTVKLDCMVGDSRVTADVEFQNCK